MLVDSSKKNITCLKAVGSLSGLPLLVFAVVLVFLLCRLRVQILRAVQSDPTPNPP